MPASISIRVCCAAAVSVAAAFAVSSNAAAQSPERDPARLLNRSIFPQPQAPAATAEQAVAQTQTPQRPPAVPTYLSDTKRTPREIVRDGEVDPTLGPSAPQDGVIDLRGPEVPEDGADPTRVDQRAPEDIAAFNNPPAGYDPLLFHIEDVSPRLDRRPRRLFEAEPYDPVGIRLGSFVLFPEIEFGTTAYTNVFAAPNGREDIEFDALPSARLVSNWSNHAFELRGKADVSSYNEFKTEDERGFEIEARSRLDITSRTNLQSVTSRRQEQESRSAIDATNAGERATVTTDTSAATLSHRFNRLSVELRGALTETDYGSVVIQGANVSNADRNVKQTSGAVRASWEFKPTLTVFGEFEGQHRDFKVAASTDGLHRDSNGQRYRAGVSFGETGAYVRGEVSLGYARQNFDDAALVDVEGLALDANLAWRVNALTSLLFTAGTEISDTTTAGSGGVLDRRLSLEARHQFRSYLIGTAGLSVASRNYAGIDIDETEYGVGVGLDYLASREVAILARYRHTTFLSDFIDGDYSADEFRLALRLRR